jgi:hypothetical protein
MKMTEIPPLIKHLNEKHLLEKYALIFDRKNPYWHEREQLPAYLIPVYIYPKLQPEDFIREIVKVYGQIFNAIYTEEIEMSDTTLQNYLKSVKSLHDDLAGVSAIGYLSEFDLKHFSPFLFEFAYERGWEEVIEETAVKNINDAIRTITSAARDALDHIIALAPHIKKALEEIRFPKSTIGHAFMRLQYNRLLEDYRDMKKWDTGVYREKLYVEEWVINYGNLPKDRFKRYGTKDGRLCFSLRIRDDFPADLWGYHLYYLSEETHKEIMKKKLLLGERPQI